VGAPTPEIVGDWDDIRLQRVFSNLIDNAIKYSPKGGEIAVSLGRITQDAAALASVAVADNGIGIPEVDLPHIFERFYRAGNVAPNMHGTGIGLAGVKQIVEQHGGSIEVKSEEGIGTTVTVLLPLS
jgi:signal transduction histidine kinase